MATHQFRANNPEGQEFLDLLKKVIRLREIADETGDDVDRARADMASQEADEWIPQSVLDNN